MRGTHGSGAAIQMETMMSEQGWIAAFVDGTRLRVWHILGGDVRAEAEAEIAPLAASAAHIVRAVSQAFGTDDLMDLPIVIAGATDAAMHRVPCTPPSPAQAIGSPQVHLIPNVHQSTPPDIILGASAQIAGFVAANPGWDGVLCLPGAQTTWAHLSAGEIVSFQSFVTTDLILGMAEGRVPAPYQAQPDWDVESFEAAVRTAMGRPAAVAAKIVELRVPLLLQKLSPATARARLLGLFIGMELAAAKPYWLGQQVAVIGDDEKARLYAQALALQAVPVTQACGDAMALRGLISGYDAIG